MKKGYSHKELSDKTCEGKNCTKHLKTRRVMEHGGTLCYSCHQEKRRREGKSHRIFKSLGGGIVDAPKGTGE